MSADGAVVADNGSATVRASLNRTQDHVGWNGCLTALGRPVHLTAGPAGGGTSLVLGPVALAGPLAALEFDHFDKDFGSDYSIDVFDLRTGLAIGGSSVPCPAELCDVDRLVVNPSADLAWHMTDVPQPPEHTFAAISCATASLCVAVDDAGNVAVSTDPTGGRPAWQLANIDPGGALHGVSCPSAGLCVAVGGFPGRVLSTADPAGGPGAWANAQITTNNLTAVSCPSTSLCVAVDDEGDVFTSENPTAGAAGWVPAVVVPGVSFTGMSCASVSLCVGVDRAGDAVVSTNPTGGVAAWSVARIEASTEAPALTGVACPTQSLCLASVQDPQGGDMLVSTQPTGGPSAWTLEHVDGNGAPGSVIIGSVTCASISFCIGFDDNGDAVSSTDPAGGATTWTTSSVDPSGPGEGPAGRSTPRARPRSSALA